MLDHVINRVILIGASAGGVHALSQLVKDLPADLPALHPKDRDPVQEGRIYVAPPDHHLIVEDGRLRLSHGASENAQRPAVDVLFRTGAQSYGRRAGVLRQLLTVQEEGTQQLDGPESRMS